MWTPKRTEKEIDFCVCLNTKDTLKITEEEKKEREKYRRLYIDKFKESLKGHLDNIKIVKVDDEGNPVDDDGNIIPAEA